MLLPWGAELDGCSSAEPYPELRQSHYIVLTNCIKPIPVIFTLSKFVKYYLHNFFRISKNSIKTVIRLNDFLIV